jgi:hypothetical protein
MANERKRIYERCEEDEEEASEELAGGEAKITWILY